MNVTCFHWLQALKRHRKNPREIVLLHAKSNHLISPLVLFMQNYSPCVLTIISGRWRHQLDLHTIVLLNQINAKKSGDTVSGPKIISEAPFCSCGHKQYISDHLLTGCRWSHYYLSCTHLSGFLCLWSRFVKVICMMYHACINDLRAADIYWAPCFHSQS